MTHLEKTLNELSNKSGSASQHTALVGLDGFVDKIIRVVRQRNGQGDDFTPMDTIGEFGEKISAAAGRSANFELYTTLEKLGGNGPIMANAIHSAGFNTRYLGALGLPIHHVFDDFARKTQAVSFCDPGITHALEFDDGKLMLGSMASLDEITYSKMLASMGEGALHDIFSRASLIALVNWTMIPNMTAVFEDLLSKVLPNIGPHDKGRHFFFDLADPAKRSPQDIRSVLQTIRRFQAFGAVTLGLNFAEARQVCEVLSLGSYENNPEELKACAFRIRSTLEISTVVVHPREGAACATRDENCYVEGPFCKRPKISTGAGDHFNAGFAVARAIGLSPLSSLTVAVATSGQYVRTGRSPSLRDTAAFIESWTKNNLSD